MPDTTLTSAERDMTYVHIDQVRDMLKEWQQSCADHPAIYNQGNVLRDRLDALAKRHQPLRSGGVALNSTQILLRAMAEALEAHGITVHCPWDGDLSDDEQERFEGLVAVLDVVEKATGKATSDMNEHVAAMLGAMGTPFRTGVFHYTDAEGNLAISDQDALRAILSLARAGLEAGKAEESMRERAATVADQLRMVATPGENALFGQGMANAADQIATAIRALPPVTATAKWADPAYIERLERGDHLDSGFLDAIRALPSQEATSHDDRD